MALPQIWVIGDWRQADFAPALDWLSKRAACLFFSTGEAVLASSDAEQREPHAILIVQSRPGQIGHGVVERLHARAPLARLAALVGSWCEGEQRSGKPWPGVVRVPWRAWRGRLGIALGIVEADECAASPLPRTASEVERLDSNWARVDRSGSAVGTAAVRTFSRNRYEALADLLLQLNWQPRWLLPGAETEQPAANVMICDGWEHLPSDAVSELHSLREPTLLLLDFPRPQDIAKAAQLGIAAVVAQPLLANDLRAALEFCRGGTSRAPLCRD